MSSERFFRISSPNVTVSPEKRHRHYNLMFDWFKRSMDYELFLTTNTLRYNIKQGEVFEVDFGRNIGSELSERHYAVAIHDSGELAQNIIVVPLTTKAHYSYGEAVELGILKGIKTTESSFAKISQIKTIDKARIYLRPIINIETAKPDGAIVGPVTKLTNEQLKIVKTALLKMLDYN